MLRRLARLQPGTMLRNYAAATLLNLALVSTVLTPSDRPQASQMRIVTTARGFRETEVLDLGDGGVGVLSVPIERRETGSMLGLN